VDEDEKEKNIEKDQQEIKDVDLHQVEEIENKEDEEEKVCIEESLDQTEQNIPQEEVQPSLNILSQSDKEKLQDLAKLAKERTKFDHDPSECIGKSKSIINRRCRE
jgi:hypothetical protein